MKLKPSTALRALRRASKKAYAPNPAPTDNRLPLSQLRIMPAVFQPRDLRGLLANESWFVDDLVRAVHRNGKKGLDPVLTWWSGKQWLVIDGHHRLEAYQKASWPHDIPVEVFVGELDEARLEASRRNTKNTLAMRQDERLQAAWRLVCTSALSKPQIADGTGVAERTVATMRSRVKEVLAARPLTWTEEKLGDEPWRTVRDGSFLAAAPSADIPEDRNQRTAQEWARRLAKQFGDVPSRNPEALAAALELFDHRLPRRLLQTEAWQHLREEALEEQAEEDHEEGLAAV